jgi:protein-disulfide isomerase
MVEQGPVSISDWPQVSSRGHHLGSARQGINVVVFSDFECPACRRFAVETLPVIERRFGAQITVLFRHWPLRQHRFAYSAARAAECAARQGRFRAFNEEVFRQQDSI